MPVASTRISDGTQATLLAFYLSRSRVLSLLNTERLPAQLLHVLQEGDAPMASSLLSNALSKYLLHAIASGNIQTLQQLAAEGNLLPGKPFIYNGHFYGSGFGVTNKRPAVRLSEKLDGLMEGKNLNLEFSKSGLLNDTAYTRMAGSTRLFAFAYIADITADAIHAIPYAIGDLISSHSSMSLPFASTLELRPSDIEQFACIEQTWLPSKAESASLANISEQKVKELICRLLGEHDVPKDWGGEESDLFSDRLLVAGRRMTGAFLLKGPAKFHPMTLRDLGKNADQIYRLFNIPADVYVIQHCHSIGAAVRKTVEAYAFQKSFSVPCRYVIMDGTFTAQLLRANGLLGEEVYAPATRSLRNKTGPRRFTEIIN